MIIELFFYGFERNHFCHFITQNFHSLDINYLAIFLRL